MGNKKVLITKKEQEMGNKKVLIKAEIEARAQKVWYLFGFVLVVLLCMFGVRTEEKTYYSSKVTYTKFFGETIKRVDTDKYGKVIDTWIDTEVLFIIFLILAVVALIPFIVQAFRKKIAKIVSLTIYEDEISGSYNDKLSQAKLKMPIEKVDNVTLISTFWSKIFPGKTVGICSASGVIKVPMVQNAEEVVEVAMKRIKEAREANKKGNMSQSFASETLTEKLSELNSLKNAGILTEEEYNQKKQELIAKM